MIDIKCYPIHIISAAYVYDECKYIIIFWMCKLVRNVMNSPIY